MEKKFLKNFFRKQKIKKFLKKISKKNFEIKFLRKIHKIYNNNIYGDIGKNRFKNKIEKI